MGSYNNCCCTQVRNTQSTRKAFGYDTTTHTHTHTHKPYGGRSWGGLVTVWGYQWSGPRSEQEHSSSSSKEAPRVEGQQGHGEY